MCLIVQLRVWPNAKVVIKASIQPVEDSAKGSKKIGYFCCKCNSHYNTDEMLHAVKENHMFLVIIKIPCQQAKPKIMKTL